MISCKRIFVFMQKNYLRRGICSLNLNNIICTFLVIVSFMLLISRNSVRQGEDQSNKVQFFNSSDKSQSQPLKSKRKADFKDAIFESSNQEAFKASEKHKLSPVKELYIAEGNVLNKQAIDDNNNNKAISKESPIKNEEDDKITESEEMFDQDEEFHPPTNQNEMYKSLGSLLKVFINSKKDNSLSKQNIENNTPKDLDPSKQNAGDLHHVTVSPSRTSEHKEDQKTQEIAANNQNELHLEYSLSNDNSEDKMVLINKLQQIDNDELTPPPKLLSSFSSVENPASDTLNSEPNSRQKRSEFLHLSKDSLSIPWITQVLKSEERNKSKKAIESVFKIFSRRNKATYGSQCSNVSPVGEQDNKFDPENAQTLCEDADFQGHFKKGCIVYSFGVNKNWDFEKSMAIRGCKVWVYHSSENEEPSELGPNINLFNYRLGISNDIKILLNQEVQFYTLEELLRMNKHSKSIISYLKINLHGEEWDILEQITTESPQIANNILQMGLTTHLHEALINHNLYEQYLNTLTKLSGLGFQLFASKEVENANEIYEEPFLDNKLVALTNYLAYIRV